MMRVRHENQKRIPLPMATKKKVLAAPTKIRCLAIEIAWLSYGVADARSVKSGAKFATYTFSTPEIWERVDVLATRMIDRQNQIKEMLVAAGDTNFGGWQPHLIAVYETFPSVDYAWGEGERALYEKYQLAKVPHPQTVQPAIAA